MSAPAPTMVNAIDDDGRYARRFRQASKPTKCRADVNGH